MTGTIEIADETAPPFDRSIAEALQSCIESTLGQAFQVQTQVNSWSVRKGPLELQSFIVCTIDMKQGDDLCSTFITALDRETVAKILHQCGVAEAQQNQQIVNDAVTEVANMIYGMFKTALNKKGYHFTMNIPVVQNADQTSHKFDDSEKMMLPFLADGHQCRIVISHNH